MTPLCYAVASPSSKTYAACLRETVWSCWWSCRDNNSLSQFKKLSRLIVWKTSVRSAHFQVAISSWQLFRVGALQYHVDRASACFENIMSTVKPPWLSWRRSPWSRRSIRRLRRTPQCVSSDRQPGDDREVQQSCRILGGCPFLGLTSQVITSKQPKLGLTQELFFSRICESTTGYTFTPCVRSFTSPGIDTRQKGPPAFSLFRKTQADVG